MAAKIAFAACICVNCIAADYFVGEAGGTVKASESSTLSPPRHHQPRTLERSELAAARKAQALAAALAAQEQAAKEAAAAAERAKAEKARAEQVARSKQASRPNVSTASASRTVTPVGDVQQAICAKFANSCAKALRVARCESGFNPGATNGPHRGLFQINVRIHASSIAAHGYTADDMWQAGPNIELAYQLSSGGTNWGPWVCQ